MIYIKIFKKKFFQSKEEFIYEIGTRKSLAIPTKPPIHKQQSHTREEQEAVKTNAPE